ncbi:MAG: polysaccharide biosynthesis tyrosine autokinase [Candidatus Omnitrophica bacterium]|nr:polysaccharide biosynthesis tyrosine autokinase [Candidatus Omnitrophota bacterium]
MPQLYELNLRDYSNIFLKRKWVVITAFSTIFLSILLYTSVQRSVYRASVLIKIETYLSRPSEVIFPNNQQIYWNPEEELSGYVKQIVSGPILESALEELGYIKTDTPQKEKRALINSLTGNTSAVEIEKSSMIRLDVNDGDPARASAIANKVSEVFKRVISQQKNQQAHNVRVFIDTALDDVSGKLIEQENHLRSLTEKGAMGTGVNLINQIYEIEKKRNDLLSKYTERHPNIVAIDEQISELKGELKELPKEEYEYGTLKRDVTINEGLYMSLKQKQSEARIKEAEKADNVILINPATPPKTPFYPDRVKSCTVGLVLGLIFGITLALVIEHIDTSIGRVEDIESFIKTSVLGVIPFCSKKGDEPDEKDLWKRLVAKIFSVRSNKEKGEKIICEAPVSAFEQSSGSIFLEAFRILSVNLQVIFGKGEKIKNKILLITSCNPEEGKSVITSNLGVIMSQIGYKVLIIDADTRRSMIHKIFGFKSKDGGLLDVLTGKMTFDSAVRTATDLMLGAAEANKVMDRPWLNNLNILTAGAVFPNPANLFNSEKMNELLDMVRKKYDVVLIDTSPILAVSEPSILIPKVDGTLLVYKAGATSRLALRRAKTQIENIKEKGLSGVILNNVTPEVGIDAYYYYNKRYYNEKEKEKYKNTEFGMEEKGGGGVDV